MFNNEINQQIIAHALAEYPREACGLVIDDGTQYVPMRNVHENPKMNFRMNMPDFVPYYQAGRINALIHSHTASYNNYPSRQDMLAQETMGLPWGIVHVNENRDIDGPFYFGDELPIASFEGRKFRDNVHDCYTLLRDVYRVEEKIILPIFPREPQWEKNSQNMLELNFKKAGFVQIDETQIKKNCVMLCRINSPSDNPVANHVAIIRDKGQILHHVRGRLSRLDPFNLYRSTAIIYLKYGGK
jgi:proteasome lid subunit RPN8/RPN11